MAANGFVIFGEVVVHVMQPAIRSYYNLEELWGERSGAGSQGDGFGMKLGILAVGHKLPEWVAQGCAEYMKRMPRELPLSVVEVKPEPRGSKTREQLLVAEKGRPQTALQGFNRIVVLDERMLDLTTLKLAQRLELDAGWWHTAFVIGGADGIDDELAARR